MKNYTKDEMLQLIIAAKDVLGEYNIDYNDPNSERRDFNFEMVKDYLDDTNKSELQKDMVSWTYTLMGLGDNLVMVGEDQHLEYIDNEVEYLTPFSMYQIMFERGRYRPEYLAAYLSILKRGKFCSCPQFVDDSREGSPLLIKNIEAMEKFQYYYGICSNIEDYIYSYDFIIVYYDRDHNYDIWSLSKNKKISPVYTDEMYEKGINLYDCIII